MTSRTTSASTDEELAELRTEFLPSPYPEGLDTDHEMLVEPLTWAGSG